MCRYWNRLEQYCRDLTSQFSEVSIISGPLFLPEKDEKTGKTFVQYEVNRSASSSKENVKSACICIICSLALDTCMVIIQVLGDGCVSVPTHLFKIILAEDTTSNSSAPWPVLGVFVIPNKPIKDVNLLKFQVSLEQLEGYTGTTFYSKLDRSVV